jgi:hypothetical protein
MDITELDLTLIPAPNDPPIRSPDYQAELRQFEQGLHSNGLEVSSTIELREAWIPELISPPYLGDFTIKLAAIFGPILGTAIGAWLQARIGRRVRLRVGPDGFEAEARTIEEVERLLERAKEFQRRNQPKVILEP